jgi:predicted lipoprotein with Yx(FWY)xxD motif
MILPLNQGAKLMKNLALTLAAILATAGTALAAEPAMVSDAANGKIYTDAKGMALYTFDKDEAGKSNCYDNCAKNWPPFAAAADATAEGDWTIVDRTDGTKMWAYDGKPLYTFIKDTKPGEVMGDGANNVWHVAKPD